MFNIQKFKKENKNIKVTIFLEFLMETCNIKNDNKSESELFSIIDEDRLIKSLEYYIDKQNVTAKITAENYVTNIKGFFKMLSNDYNIDNPIFKNFDEYSKFKEKANFIINRLKDTAADEIALSENYNEVHLKIEQYNSNINNESTKIKDDIDDTGNKGYYNLLVSCIATKMLLSYGFKNDVISSLKITDIDLKNQTLKRGPHYLEIDNILLNLFEHYLNFRNIILQNIDLNTDYFLIRTNGKPITNGRENADNSILFKFLGTKTATKIYSHRRIWEMLKDGYDISIIHDITGYSINKCIKIQKLFREEMNMDNNVIQTSNKLYSFSFDNKNVFNIDHEQNNFIICPNCKSKLSNSEENWVLILKEDGIKYLVCQNCKGVL